MTPRGGLAHTAAGNEARVSDSTQNPGDAPPDSGTTTEGGAARGRPRRPAQGLLPAVWETWEDERLLDLRLCDLRLQLNGSPIDPLIRQVLKELRAKGLRFRPHFWIADDWFTPDGVPGVAVPFYVVHPRLARIEQSFMLEVEGGTPEWALRILRHEVGHAIENAFRLRRRKKRRELFGSTAQPYPDSYIPRPYSKSYVNHLESWYAQSHPDEDFAETFAVWLTPGSEWAKRYAGWKALRKLEYVDTLMKELAGRPPLVANRRRVDALPTLRKTLREHYDDRLHHYGIDEPDLYDRDLKKLFSSGTQYAQNPTAASFIQRVRRETRRLVRRWTGEYQYTIDQVLADMITRSRELGLRLTGPEEQARQEFMILLTVQTMNYLHSGRHRLAL